MDDLSWRIWWYFLKVKSKSKCITEIFDKNHLWRRFQTIMANKTFYLQYICGDKASRIWHAVVDMICQQNEKMWEARSDIAISNKNCIEFCLEIYYWYYILVCVNRLNKNIFNYWTLFRSLKLRQMHFRNILISSWSLTCASLQEWPYSAWLIMSYLLSTLQQSKWN